MIVEQWTRWEPIKGLSEKYYINSVSHSDSEGLKIVLSDANDRKKKVQVIFEHVCSYRRTGESFRFGVIDALDKQYETSFCAEWAFFKVVNSSYALWASEESVAFEPDFFTHFSLIASNSIVDILARFKPFVEYIDL